ncbi:MAG: hypothetical protein KA988_02490 [Longilinea sp.]|nr:hypothetical protein [Longilinea sp.]MCA1954575.1 hypothetical protein [Anaerolinea sp.]
MDLSVLLIPPIAFLIYVPLVFIIFGIGKALAPDVEGSSLKRTLYGSGEMAQVEMAAPGYRPFFLIAFFFAILHLGVLVLATGVLTPTMIPYLAGLMLALIALLLG